MAVDRLHYGGDDDGIFRAPTYVTGLPLFVSPALFGGLSGVATSICNLGGFFGPIGVGALITWNGGNKLAGIFFLAACYILSGICILFVRLGEKKAVCDNNPVVCDKNHIKVEK